MKIDVDYARELLLEIEKKDRMSYSAKNNWVEDKKAYHLNLLYERKLIKASKLKESFGFDMLIDGITSEGHEFLDMARNKTLWEEAKKSVLESEYPLDIKETKTALKFLMKRYLG